MIDNRLVLDTNVCLDLFVFRDPRCALLHAALQAGTVKAYTRIDCRAEWLLVLHYAHLALVVDQIAQYTRDFDALITCLPPLTSFAHNMPILLPRCSDKDDQKFLEAARDSKAQTLITKDKALLKLASKCHRAGLFQILKPEAWVNQRMRAAAIS